jgi:glycine betaine catabolism B
MDYCEYKLQRVQGFCMKFETFVKEIIPRVSEVASFRFPRPAELDYKPGQYMLVTVKSGSKELMHPFSFSSSPTEKDCVEFTKKFTESEYSTTLKAFKPGAWARIDAPYGTFTFMGEHQKIVLLAGGIGITPFLSICKYCTDIPLKTDIVMFYGCRNESEIVFKQELEKIAKQNPNLKVIFVLNEASSDWKGKVGFITADLLKIEVPDFKDRIFYACGPPVMVTAMGKVITDLGLPSTQLKFESLVGHT